MGPLIKMTGTKCRLLKKLLSKYKQSDIYVEPFCGSATLFFNLPDDSYKQAYLFDTSQVIIDILEFTKRVTDEELEEYRVKAIEWFENVSKVNNKRLVFDSIERNDFGTFLLMCVQVFSFSLFFRWSIQNKQYYINNGVYINSPFSHFLTPEQAVDRKINDIKEARPKLQKAVIQCKSFFDVYQDFYMKENVTMFCDPPYINGCVRYSGGDFNLETHKHFTEIINQAKCKIIYTDYENEFLGPHFHSEVTRNCAYQVVKRKDKIKKMEYLYRNYSVSTGLF